MKTIFEIKEIIEGTKCRSAWSRGVREYAIELCEKLIDEAEWNGLKDDDFKFHGSRADKKAMLNGAQGWKEYSWGGCSLIYDTDIAERLCSASELKKTNYGERRPNANEEWLDTQARALFQAAYLICEIAKGE